MEFVFLGWPSDGPRLELDHRRFAYAGKFVMRSTGKAIVRTGDQTIAAVSFSPDRTRDDRMWIRYVTVEETHRGRRIAPRLVGATVDRILAHDFAVVTIAVNNPFSYVAMSRAGFGFTGETTGIAEVVCSTDVEQEPVRFRAGMGVVIARAPASPAERRYAATWMRRDPPSPCPRPELVDGQ